MSTVSVSIATVSDFGFEAHSLDGDELASHPHPLENARDLIAAGKPRFALEVLSLHHHSLADDPEYLFICAEAWWAAGDALRARQALLGAARLRPDDPTPLQMLGALLRELGEHDKADRVFARAQSLETSDEQEPPEADGSTDDGDLIASAESQERATRAGLTLTQWLATLIALVAVAGLIAAIGFLTQAPDTAPEFGSAREAAREPAPNPDPELDPAPDLAREPTPAPELEPAPESATLIGIATASETEPEAGTASETEPETAIVTETETEPETATATAIVTETETETATEPKPARRPRAVRKPRVSEPAAPPEPDASTVQRELASLDAAALTRRGDALYAQGHTSLAASYYRSALDRDPDYAPALVGIGRSILRAESYDDAMENATHALQHARGVDARPGLEAEAIYQIARVHLNRGELDAARRLFRQSISLPGSPAEAWFYLGEALWTDNSAAARAAYERYLELVPRGSLADRARRAIR